MMMFVMMERRKGKDGKREEKMKGRWKDEGRKRKGGGECHPQC